MEGRGACGGGGEDGKTDSILRPPGPAPRAPCASLSPARVPCLPHECQQGSVPALVWGAGGQVGAHNITGDPRGLGQHSAGRTVQPSFPVTPSRCPTGWGCGEDGPPRGGMSSCAQHPALVLQVGRRKPHDRPGEPLSPSHRAGACRVGVPRGGETHSWALLLGGEALRGVKQDHPPDPALGQFEVAFPQLL